MKEQWIDGKITPSILNTALRCVLYRTNGSFSLGVYSCPDGWFDILDGEEINNGLIQAYLPLRIPKKTEYSQTTIEWK